MKVVLSTLFLAVLILSSCSSEQSEDQYIGGWAQVNANGPAQLTASISKDGTDLHIDISMPVPNGKPVKMTKTGKFKDGIINAERMEKIFLTSNGHLMIGANEFEKMK